MENSKLPPNNGKNELKSDFPKLKILQNPQKYFAILGINSNALVQQHTFNRRILTSYFVFGLQFISEFTFVFHESKTFWEYIQSTYFCSVSVMCTAIFSILVIRASLLFKDIAKIESVLISGKWAFKIEISRKQSIKCS